MMQHWATWMTGWRVLFPHSSTFCCHFSRTAASLGPCTEADTISTHTQRWFRVTKPKKLKLAEPLRQWTPACNLLAARRRCKLPHLSFALIISAPSSSSSRRQRAGRAELSSKLPLTNWPPLICFLTFRVASVQREPKICGLLSSLSAAPLLLHKDAPGQPVGPIDGEAA